MAVFRPNYRWYAATLKTRYSTQTCIHERNDDLITLMVVQRNNKHPRFLENIPISAALRCEKTFRSFIS